MRRSHDFYAAAFLRRVAEPGVRGIHITRIVGCMREFGTVCGKVYDGAVTRCHTLAFTKWIGRNEGCFALIFRFPTMVKTATMANTSTRFARCRF